MSKFSTEKTAPRQAWLRPFGWLSNSLTNKLVFGIVLAVLIPFLIASYLISLVTTGELRNQAGNSVSEVAILTANQFNRSLAQNIDLLQGVAIIEPIIDKAVEKNNAYRDFSNQEIRSSLESLDQAWINAADDDPLIANTISDDAAINFVAHQLQDFQERFPAHVEVFVTDKYGALIGATGRTSDYFQADEVWWQVAWNDGAGGLYIGQPEFDESVGLEVVNVALPVVANSEVVGVLRTTLNIQILKDIVAEHAFGEGQAGHIAVFDKDGTIIFNEFNPAAVGMDMPAAFREAGILGGTEAGWVRSISGLGEDVIVGYTRVMNPDGLTAIDNLNWTIGAVLPTDLALAPANSAARLYLLLGVTAIFLSVILVTFIVRGSTHQIGHIGNLFKQINAGNYTARAEVVTQDELGQMTEDLNRMLDNTLMLIQSQEERDRLQSAIIKLLDEVADVAEGDLTVEAEVTAELTGAIADAFNFMITQLRTIISGVQETSYRVTASAQSIQDVTERLAQSSETQAARINSASTEIQTMAKSMRKVSENAAQSATVAHTARSNAQRGATSVRNTIRGMDRIQNQVQETAKRISRLGQNSEEINEIVQLIEDIADQTSILALNASIQAAAAGEAGRGFAVVATEVDDLAAQAAQAAQQISTLIKSIRSEITETVSATEQSLQEVDAGSTLADQAGQTLLEIEQVSNELAGLIQGITESTQQQAKEIEGVATSMSEIAQLTQGTAGETRQTAVTIDGLAGLTSGLRRSVSTFKLPDGEEVHATEQPVSHNGRYQEWVEDTSVVLN